MVFFIKWDRIERYNMLKFILVFIIVGMVGCAGYVGKSKVEFTDASGNPVKFEHEVAMPKDDKKDK